MMNLTRGILHGCVTPVALLAAMVLFLSPQRPIEAQTTDPGIMQKVYLAKEMFPNLKTIGILCNTNTSSALLKSMNIAGTAYQVVIKVYGAKDLMEMRESFDRMNKEGHIDLVWVLPDDVVNQQYGRRFLAERCMSMKIPLYLPSVENLREGGLFTIASDVDNKSKAFVNKKVQDMLGVTFPAELSDRIIPVEY